MKIDEHFSKKIAKAHKDILPSKENARTYGEIARNIDEDANVVYKINSSGHRSDEFTTIHDGLHILFAGCSVTFGEGLPHMSNWSGRLYKKISSTHKTSGYFNLSFLGGSTDLIVANIYKYIVSYGKPDIIFLHAPDRSRHISYSDGEYRNLLGNHHEPIGLSNLWYSYNAMIAFEMFCQASGINLIWTCWSDKDIKFYKGTKMFNCFLAKNKVDYVIASKNNEQKHSKYYNFARDRVHPGLRYSDGLANLLYEEFLKINFVPRYLG